MAKSLQTLFSFLLILAAVFWSFYSSMPRDISGLDTPETEFSTARAFQKVKAIAEKPHYLGSESHSEVRNYLVSQLQALGLLVQTQQKYSLNKYGVLTRPQNILARIKGTGNGKALLLLSHYDSAMHSSFGASDDASGVATILEGIRAFLASGTSPKNDIIILFTDAEELGLNGAEIFVNKHPWAKDVGLALNFEARGSGGNSIMLLETNQGNKNLIRNFIKANPEFPVSNSLAYSVYKMLPNDTDLTVLREQGNINGFNFAFIGDHFDYHTANDVPKNLDLNTLAHQGSYLMPLLNYFSNISLENLDSQEDLIYFNVPFFHMISYPFSWIYPMLFIAIGLFVVFLIFGFLSRKLRPNAIFKSFTPLLIALFAVGIISFLLWQFCLLIYPQYLEILQNFPYNGYYYIAAFTFLALTISFYSYQISKTKISVAERYTPVLFVWLLICFGTAIFLKGATYFIIPVFFGLLQWLLILLQRKPNILLLTLLSLPALLILPAFVENFPVALGLNSLFLAGLLVVLIWVLLLPIFGFYKKTQWLGFISFLIFLGFFITAHFISDFSETRPKPNSLVYLLDSDSQLASWNTYDKILDSWTTPYFEKHQSTKSEEISFSSKYNTNFNFRATAPAISLPEPFIEIEKLADSADFSNFSIKIAANRKVNRMDIFTKEIINFRYFRVNDLEARNMKSGKNPLHIFQKRWDNRLLTYFLADQDTLRLEFSLPKGAKPDFIFYGASYDLLQNQELQVPPRSPDMIPKPFVSNDAVILKKEFTLTSTKNKDEN